MAQPTALEQEMLEMINRMRLNPAAELDLLINSNDAGVNSAIDYFDVDLNVLKNQWDDLNPAQPVAWSSALNNAASKHSDLMIKADKQSHQLSGEPGLGERVSNAGYDNWSTVAENVYAYSNSVFFGHAGFAIDWGNTSTGIQNPPGHRDNIMSDRYREVGVDITAENNNSTQVGPYVITQNFGDRRDLDNQGWLLGVVYEDKDEDKFYDAGEGLNNVDISITGINGTDYDNDILTMNAGGYQVLLNPGIYQVDFWQNGSLLSTKTAAIDDENVKLDLLVSSELTLNNTNNNPPLEEAVENKSLVGGKQEDTLIGGAGKDSLNGGSGDDVLEGKSGNDWLYGDQGNDNLSGGKGDDELIGALGNDTIVGGNGSDTVIGNKGNDSLNGGKGDDLLDGRSGNDWLDGDQGDDNLFGDKGNDTLVGGSGDDTLVGVDAEYASPGTGTVDVLRGDDGADTFVLGDKDQVYYDDGISNNQGLNDYALIQSFNSSQDEIQLHGSQSDYVLKSNLNGLPEGRAILRDGDDELIAVVQGNSFSLDSDAIVFV